jgi:hypothetical protein
MTKLHYSRDSLGWLKTEAGAVRGEEITVALLARVGRGEAKGAMTGAWDGFWVCVRERILLPL